MTCQEARVSRIRSRIQSFIYNLVQLEPGEGYAVFWSCSYFFSLLCSYYIIRPVRDEMGILGGVENLQWLFTGTLIAMTAAVPLFGWVSSRFPRRQFLPYVYAFFIAMLLLFYTLMAGENTSIYVARAFFIWTSVFNLFVVSVFWSFMADLYSNAQAKRLFAFIAAGGTLGALAGPTLTTFLVQPFGTSNLLLLSAFLLTVAIFCIFRLSQWSERTPPDERAISDKNSDAVIGGKIWDGVTLVFKSPYLMGICLLMILFTTLATFLYFMQAQIIRDAFVDSAQRTAVFAAIDLAVNILTLVFQLFLTGRLIQWFGLPVVLALIPLLLACGFALIGFQPVLIALIAVQVIRRAGNYAVMRPAREMLYVVLPREQKYKAKNFIDTFIYRGGDAVSAWVYAGMRSLGAGISTIAFIAVPLAIFWAWIAYGLGKQQRIIASRENTLMRSEK